MASRASREDLEFGKLWERSAAQAFINRRWPGATLAGCPTFSHIDFSVVQDGRMIAFIEVKRRKMESGRYPSTIVSWEKHDAGRFTKKYFKVPVFCLIVFDDKVGYFDLATNPDGKQFVGRADRGGAGGDHAVYNNEHFIWIDGLLEEIEALIRTEGGFDALLN